jgi:hypothetical protein
VSVVSYVQEAVRLALRAPLIAAARSDKASHQRRGAPTRAPHKAREPRSPAPKHWHRVCVCAGALKSQAMIAKDNHACGNCIVLFLSSSHLRCCSSFERARPPSLHPLHASAQRDSGRHTNDANYRGQAPHTGQECTDAGHRIAEGEATTAHPQVASLLHEGALYYPCTSIEAMAAQGQPEAPPI